MPIAGGDLPEGNRKEVMYMESYEIVMTILGILGLVVSVIKATIALLEFIDRHNRSNK